MEGMIRTVTGDIQPCALGFTQSHEHILLRKGESFKVSSVLWQDEPKKSALELKDYHLAGGRAIVDAQPVGCGRMAGELFGISKASGVKIIASTGFHKLLFYPENHWIYTLSEEKLQELFVSELTRGMFEDGDDALPVKRTSHPAGQIKTAVDTFGLTETYRRLFRAAAGASRETGAPIMIHIEAGADPLPVLELLRSGGIAPERMIFCHLDRACPDLRVHEAVASEGAWLEYDTIGRFKYHSDARECEILKAMTQAGYAGQILLSLDTTRGRLGHYGGEIALTYLIRTFLPQLRSAGIREPLLTRFFVENPAEAFCWKKPSADVRITMIRGDRENENTGYSNLPAARQK